MYVKQYPPPGFTERLREAILSSDLTITEIARQTNLSRPLIYAYAYNGTVPTTTSLYKLCVTLHMSADYLLFGGKKCNI